MCLNSSSHRGRKWTVVAAEAAKEWLARLEAAFPGSMVGGSNRVLWRGAFWQGCAFCLCKGKFEVACRSAAEYERVAGWAAAHSLFLCWQPVQQVSYLHRGLLSGSGAGPAEECCRHDLPAVGTEKQ